MSARPGNNYPHVMLHAITGLIAIAALALAAYNFRESKKLKHAAVPVPPGAVLHKSAEFVSSEKTVKKKVGDEARSTKKNHKKSKKKKTTAPRESAVKAPARSESVQPARSRGLDEIVSDLVDYVTR